MTIRKTFQWMLLILLLAAVGGGGYTWWMWHRSDILLREMILAKIKEKAPGWDITIDRTHYDWQRRVLIQGVQLKVKGESEAFVSIPEMIITIDRDALVDRQEVLIHKIQIQQPTINLARHPDGTWNFQQLPPLPKSKSSKGAAPEIEIQQAVVHVLLQHGKGIKTGEITLDNADFKIVPSGKRQFVIQGLTHVNQAGNLEIEGEWNGVKKSWSLHGHMKDVTSNGELSSLALGVAPDLRERFSQANAALQKKLSPSSARNPLLRHDVELVSDESFVKDFTLPVVSTPVVSGDAFATIGIEATVDVEFRIAKWDSQPEPDFAIHVDVKKGEISNPVLPFPLRNLQGSFDWDNEKIVLKKLTATNEQTNLSLIGQAKRASGSILSRYDLTITNMQFGNRLRTRIPQPMWKLYDSLQPTGFADVRCSLLSDASGKWSVQNFLLEAKGLEVRPVQFPYPLTQIVGTAKQVSGKRDLELSFTGYAGSRPVNISGYVKNVGREAEMGFNLRVKKLPVDEALLSACKPAARKTLEALKFQGKIDDIRMAFYRPPGLKKKLQSRLVAQILNGSINYDKFPYPIDKISGHILFDSSKKNWDFRNLVGYHKSTKIGLTGTFGKRDIKDPGALQLTILVQGGHFDRALERALPESVQKGWDIVSPKGNLDFRTEIEWIPGQKVHVTLPEVTMSKGSILLRSFPYALENVKAKFRYENDRLEILAFDATHDETKVSVIGFVECPHNKRGDWRVRLKEIYVNRMRPDRTLRRALPEDLQKAVESLNPQGKMSLVGMVEFRGTGQPNEPVTAAWDLEFLLPKNELTTGVALSNVKGHLFLRGTFDGSRVKLAGKIDLNQATFLDYTFYDIRGPFRLIGKQLIVGSREALMRTKRTRNQKPINPSDRITAHFSRGIATLDAAAVLSEETPYRLKATISRGSLKRFAKLYLPKMKKINGVINGWIDLHGRGSETAKMSGRGQVQIHPAALYELPAMAQMFKVLSFVPPDKTAFNYAFADFTVAKEKYYFNTIDLAGDAISFRGKGTVGFDTSLNLDFYSMLPRKGVPIPLLGISRSVIGAATKGWVAVQLRGKTSQPVATVSQAPLLDEAMKIFKGVPQLLIQPLTPEQVAPLRNNGRNPQRYRLR